MKNINNTFHILMLSFLGTQIFAENTSIKISGTQLKGTVAFLAAGKSITVKLNNGPTNLVMGRRYSFPNGTVDVLINSNSRIKPNSLSLIQEPLDQDCYFGGVRTAKSNSISFPLRTNASGEIIVTNLPPITCDSAKFLSGTSIRGRVENLASGTSLRMQYGNHAPINVTPDRNGFINFRAYDVGTDRLITTVRGGSDIIRIINTPGEQECYFEPSSNRTRVYRFDDVFVQRDPKTRRIIAGGTVPISQTVSQDGTSMRFNYFVPFLNFRPMGWPNFHVYLPQNYVIHCK